MSERSDMMKQVQMYDFAKLETVLYLDCHPQNQEALQYLHDQMKKSDEAVKAYEEKFGPLTSNSDREGMSWTWVQDPWPWEKEAN